MISQNESMRSVLSRAGKYLGFHMICGFVILLFSCTDVAPPVYESFIFEEEDNYFIFKTNESENNKTAFYSIEESALVYPIDDVKVEVLKESGYSLSDFGLVYGYIDENNYYLFSIDVMGNYCIKKQEAGVFTRIVDWTETDILLAGYGQKNILQLNHNGTGIYTIMANGQILTSLNLDAYSSGKVGYFAFVASSENENFPEEPVYIKYRVMRESI